MEAKQKHCPLCEENCPLNATKCGKGKIIAALDGMERFGSNRGAENEDALLMSRLRLAARGPRHRHNWNGKQSQNRVLSILARVGEISQRELMDIMYVRSASLSELLAKLETAGYVERTQNEQDKRSVNIRLTESGSEAAEKAETPDGIFEILSGEEKKTLGELLEKLIAGWEAQSESEGFDSPFGGEPPPFGGRGFPGGPRHGPGGPGQGFPDFRRGGGKRGF